MPYAVPKTSDLAMAPSVKVSTAAEILECDESTIRRMLRRGDLTGHRIGTRAVRVYADSIVAYQRGREIAPTAEAPQKRRKSSANYRAAEARLRAAGYL